MEVIRDAALVSDGVVMNVIRVPVNDQRESMFVSPQGEIVVLDEDDFVTAGDIYADGKFSTPEPEVPIEEG